MSYRIHKSLLTKSLNFNILRYIMQTALNLDSFKLFFGDTGNLDIVSNEDLDFVREKAKEAAPLFCRNFNLNVPQNLSYDEFIALQKLSKNKELMIEKYDKGNSVVIVQSQGYIKEIDNILF